jgi:hypothetical protein
MDIRRPIQAYFEKEPGMEKKMLRKATEGENSAGDDLHPPGAIQTGSKNGGQIRADEGFAAFQAYKLDGANARKRTYHPLPFPFVELFHGRSFNTAVTAMERATGCKRDIQK